MAAAAAAGRGASDAYRSRKKNGKQNRRFIRSIVNGRRRRRRNRAGRWSTSARGTCRETARPSSRPARPVPRVRLAGEHAPLSATSRLDLVDPRPDLTDD